MATDRILSTPHHETRQSRDQSFSISPDWEDSPISEHVPVQDELSPFSKAFLLLVLLECIALIGVDIYLLAKDNDSFFYATFIVNAVFFVYLAIDSIRTENATELYSVLIARTFLTFYLVVAYFGNLFSSSGVLLAVFFVINVVYWILGEKIRRGFGWFAFKRQGASVRNAEVYLLYQVSRSSIKLSALYGLEVGMAGIFTCEVEEGRPHCHRFFEGYGIVRVIIVVLLLIIGLRASSQLIRYKQGRQAMVLFMGGTSACTLVGTIALGLWFKAFHRSPVFGHVLFTGLVDALLVVFSLWQTEKLLVATTGSGAIQGCRSGPGSIDRNLLLDDDPLADLQLQLPSSRMRFSLALPPSDRRESIAPLGASVRTGG